MAQSCNRLFTTQHTQKCAITLTFMTLCIWSSVSSSRSSPTNIPALLIKISTLPTSFLTLSKDEKHQILINQLKIIFRDHISSSVSTFKHRSAFPLFFFCFCLFCKWGQLIYKGSIFGVIFHLCVINCFCHYDGNINFILFITAQILPFLR